MYVDNRVLSQYFKLMNYNIGVGGGTPIVIMYITFLLFYFVFFCFIYNHCVNIYTVYAKHIQQIVRMHIGLVVWENKQNVSSSRI